MKTSETFKLNLFKPLVLLFLLLSFSCEEEMVDDMKEDEQEETDDTNGGSSEAPSELAIVFDYAGTYDVVEETTGTHDRKTITIGEDGSVDFDTDISFAASDVQAVYDRIECCLRIQLSYGADDDGEVVNLFLNDAADALASVQFRHRNAEIDIEVTVSPQ